MNYSDACFELTKRSEGCVLHAYWDVDAPSIGFGHHSGVRMGDTCTQERADQWLREDLQYVADIVTGLVKVPLKQGMLDGLTDLAFNIGPEAFKNSTLLHKLNMGDIPGASEEFERWDKVKGATSEDLLERRRQEKALFLEA